MSSKITDSEERLAEHAQRLLDWFAKGRDIPDRFTGKLVVEPMFVRATVQAIQEEYKVLEELTCEYYR